MKSVCAALALGAMLCVAAFAADVTFGTATAAPGKRANGFIAAPPGADAAANLPVILINGAKSGPVLSLICGAHGTEYASIIAMHKLARTVDPGALSGTVVILPLLNQASFAQMIPHLNPVDGKSMNRLYPGKADGTQTERISFAVTQQVLAKSDYVMDFHGGDLDENLRRYSYWADTGNQQMDSVSRGMVLAFGLDHIIIQRNRNPAANGAVTVSRQAQNMGKPTIVVEAGHSGTVAAEDVDVLVKGSLNVMRHLHMLPGDAPPVEHPIWIANATVIASDRDGFFHPLVTPEAYVQKGMRIGYATDAFGEKTADFVAPVTGVVIYVRAVPSLKKGDNVADIGEIAGDPSK
jgi:predicted deacylase